MPSTMFIPPRHSHLRWHAVRSYNRLFSYQCRALPFIVCYLTNVGAWQWLHFLVSSSIWSGKPDLTSSAIFLVGFVTLVFGFEMAWRGFRSERFAPRGKWNTTICVAVVAFLILLTWMPTIVWPMYNRCFGSLIWFPMRYDLLTLIILCVLVFFLLLLAALISIQLMRTPEMDPNERISASRMTYFLIVAALIYVSSLEFLTDRY